MVDAWEVEFTEDSLDDLAALDSVIAQRIFRKLRWLTDNFDRLPPEPLTGRWRGKYKLRVGDWRAVYTTDAARRVLRVHLVEHRSRIYKER